MALATRLSNEAARAAADAVAALLNGGTVKIYTGTQPTDPDTAIGAQVLLATLTFGSPAFSAAIDANPGGRAVANTITGDSAADATGTAAWFRTAKSGGEPVSDGSVGTSASDMIVNTVAFIAGAEVIISSFHLTQPET